MNREIGKNTTLYFFHYMHVLDLVQICNLFIAYIRSAKFSVWSCTNWSFPLQKLEFGACQTGLSLSLRYI